MPVVLMLFFSLITSRTKGSRVWLAIVHGGSQGVCVWTLWGLQEGRIDDEQWRFCSEMGPPLGWDIIQVGFRVSMREVVRRRGRSTILPVVLLG